jgi:hypothetical protein
MAVLSAQAHVWPLQPFILFLSTELLFVVFRCKTSSIKQKVAVNRGASLFLFYTQVPATTGNVILIWLRHYATSRKVAGSVPDEVIGFFI